MRLHTLFVLAAATGAFSLAGGAAPVQAQAAGKITGKISFNGVAPAPIKIRISADPRCMKGNPAWGRAQAD
jgi:hypothetical protein